MTIRIRRLMGFAAIAGLVFAQAVLVAHACDDLMPACHRGADDSASCVAHCAQPVPSAESSPAVAILPPAGAITVQPAQYPACSGAARALFDASLLHSTSPPIAIRDCRLRF